MAISLSDQFYGTDWEKYSTLVGKLSPAALLIIAILSMFLGFNMITTIYTLCVAALIAVVELQVLSCIQPIDRIRNNLYELLHLESYLSKAISLAALSVLCYFGSSLTIFAGTYLDISSLLYIFAWLNKRHDLAYQTAAGAEPASNTFGTF